MGYSVGADREKELRHYWSITCVYSHAVKIWACCFTPEAFSLSRASGAFFYIWRLQRYMKFIYKGHKSTPNVKCFFLAIPQLTPSLECLGRYCGEEGKRCSQTQLSNKSCVAKLQNRALKIKAAVALAPATWRSPPDTFIRLGFLNQMLTAFAVLISHFLQYRYPKTLLASYQDFAAWQQMRINFCNFLSP